MIALSVALSLPSIALAHGRQPQLTTIALDPSDPDRIVLTATHGMLISSDAGASWIWVCAAAFGADPLTEDPDVVVTGDGSIVLSTFAGIALAREDLCDYDYPDSPLVRDVFIVDVALDPASPQAVWALASSGVDPDRVVRSADAGRTWTAVGDPIEDILLERVLVAPSDPMRVYVSGAIPPTSGNTRQAFVMRSDDGGATFSRVEIPLLDGERLPHVMAIDPTNADRVFVRMVHGSVDPRNERMLVSEDGAQTFTSALELPQMHSVAISEDGQKTWIGSALNGGLWMAQGGTDSFEQVNDVDVTALAVRGGTLLVGVDQLTAEYALGRSTDDGATIDPILRFQDAQTLPQCEGCSAVAQQCVFWRKDLRTDLQIYFTTQEGVNDPLPDAGPVAECAMDGGVDAGADGGVAPPTGGCGCTSAPARPIPIGTLLTAIVALAALRRR